MEVKESLKQQALHKESLACAALPFPYMQNGEQVRRAGHGHFRNH